jgi:hypothetical protein
MTNNKTTKTDEVVELEQAIMTVLWANPKATTFDEFRRLFSEHLTKVCFFDEFQLEIALRCLDRGDLEFPASLPFTVPATATPVRA